MPLAAKFVASSTNPASAPSSGLISLWLHTSYPCVLPTLAVNGGDR